MTTSDAAYRQWASLYLRHYIPMEYEVAWHVVDRLIQLLNSGTPAAWDGGSVIVSISSFEEAIAKLVEGWTVGSLVTEPDGEIHFTGGGFVPIR